MGACICKERTTNDDTQAYSVQTAAERRLQRARQLTGYTADDDLPCFLETCPFYTDRLILNVLEIISSIGEVTQEDLPAALVELNKISNGLEEGLLIIIKSLIRTIPMDNPLGVQVITILLDDCPLPSKASILKIPYEFNLCADRAKKAIANEQEERNLLIVLGCIAEKMAGPGSVTLFTPATLDYLFAFFFTESSSPILILFALISLEKFAGTTENKSSILARLSQMNENPILNLLKYVDHPDYAWRQVGFCAQWCLDNLILIEGRDFSYRSLDLSLINVMLDAHDMNQHLKISPNGLEARCDSHSFESVRCTFSITEGCWYYEALIITPGVMQIGVASKQSKYLNFDGYGVGDNSDSIAYDGCRSLIWHNARSVPQCKEPWKSGDILGCLIDLNRCEVIFSINGVQLDPCYKTFLSIKKEFFAAASFMSFQQCKFNFGAETFFYPPTDREFKNFNEHAQLSAADKIILPRHIYLEELRKLEAPQNACSICYDSEDLVVVEPCKHTGFCSGCIALVDSCPMCRAMISSAETEGQTVKE